MKNEDGNTVAVAYWHKSFLPKKCQYCGGMIPRRRNHVVIDWYCVTQEHYCDPTCARQQILLDRSDNGKKYCNGLNARIFGE